MDKKVNRLTKNINEAKNIKNIFNIIGTSSLILCFMCLMLIAMFSEKVHIGVFVLVFILCIFLFGTFIFSNIVVSSCEEKIEEWTVRRNYLINQIESTKTKFDIANAFAHCYWNALNGDGFLNEQKRMELNFDHTEVIEE